MTEHASTFRRLLLQLPYSREDYRAVEMTVRFADLLGLNLIATFLEDDSLTGIAGLPFVRELRPLTGGWQPIDAAQLRLELQHASVVARRDFEKAVRSAHVRTSFSVAQGRIEDTIGSLVTAEDIVVVIEPKNPAERVSQQFLRQIDIVFRTAPAVLIVPHRLLRSSGPIAAIAVSPDDNSIRTAIGIADAAQEPVVILAKYDTRTVTETPQSAGRNRRVNTHPLPGHRADLASLISELVSVNEQLIVVDRGILDDSVAIKLASIRGVPILIIDAQRSPGGG